MPDRRTFIKAAAAVAAVGIAGVGDAPAAQAAPKGPSAVARSLAKWLQQTLPQAHLSDDLVDKIAGDIDGGISSSAHLRKTQLQNWDEPDFAFVAGPIAKLP